MILKNKSLKKSFPAIINPFFHYYNKLYIERRVYYRRLTLIPFF